MAPNISLCGGRLESEVEAVMLSTLSGVDYLGQPAVMRLSVDASCAELYVGQDAAFTAIMGGVKGSPVSWLNLILPEYRRAVYVQLGGTPGVRELAVAYALYGVPASHTRRITVGVFRGAVALCAATGVSQQFGFWNFFVGGFGSKTWLAHEGMRVVESWDSPVGSGAVEHGLGETSESTSGSTVGGVLPDVDPFGAQVFGSECGGVRGESLECEPITSSVPGYCYLECFDNAVHQFLIDTVGAYPSFKKLASQPGLLCLRTLAQSVVAREGKGHVSGAESEVTLAIDQVVGGAKDSVQSVYVATPSEVPRVDAYAVFSERGGTGRHPVQDLYAKKYGWNFVYSFGMPMPPVLHVSRLLGVKVKAKLCYVDDGTSELTEVQANQLLALAQTLVWVVDQRTADMSGGRLVLRKAARLKSESAFSPFESDGDGLVVGPDPDSSLQLLARYVMRDLHRAASLEGWRDVGQSRHCLDPAVAHLLRCGVLSRVNEEFSGDGDECMGCFFSQEYYDLQTEHTCQQFAMPSGGHGKIGGVFHVESDRLCAICQDDFPTGDTMTRCGHIYHGACLKQWIEFSFSFKCPGCRTLITS